ncbi:MAG: aspartate/tyrosine/aromatic aminotransferase [Porticoccaceae bacterium]|nr:aspartate/tyrosine/aromatic aminotransferase [Porticoccaceae bacterium]
MFNILEALPPDPILGLTTEYKADPRNIKIDLGVGVYKDEVGHTPVMAAIKAAEKALFDAEDSKSYIAQVGVEAFNAGILGLVLGSDHAALREKRATAVMTPGGTGALRLGGELIVRMNPKATIWVGDPTWANHIPVLQGAGLKLVTYPYYDKATSSIRFDEMLAALEKAESGDAVLLHGCCHNPCGADLSQEQWQALAHLMLRKELLPFVDLAYQGFGEGLDEDAYGIRLLAEQLPDVLVASSCSKNFGLYRERTGSVICIAQSPEKAAAGQSHVAHIARAIYSMPPAHGGFLAGMVLSDAQLRADWVAELATMRNRMNDLRSLFVRKMAEKDSPVDFGFIEKQFGMFSFLGISPEQIKRLKEEFAIYIVGSSRINVAGISESGIDYLTDSLVKVLKS